MTKERAYNIGWGFGGMFFGALLVVGVVMGVGVFMSNNLDRTQAHLLTDQQIKAIAESLNRIEESVSK